MSTVSIRSVHSLFLGCVYSLFTSCKHVIFGCFVYICEILCNSPFPSFWGLHNLVITSSNFWHIILSFVFSDFLFHVVGRVIFELFTDVAPKTVENFRCLCTGSRYDLFGNKLHYKDTPFHRSMLPVSQDNLPFFLYLICLLIASRTEAKLPPNYDFLAYLSTCHCSKFHCLSFSLSKLQM